MSDLINGGFYLYLGHTGLKSRARRSFCVFV